MEQEGRQVLTAIYNYPENGYRPAEELVVGQEYEVEDVSMGQSYTSIFLKGYTGVFNSVQFDFYENGKPHDIFRDSRYNPYMEV
jgi:uncharacterized protein (DUF4213/DUF364 family)